MYQKQGAILFALFALIGCLPDDATRNDTDPKEQINSAILMYEHGLGSASKQIFVQTYLSGAATDSIRAEALYWLGRSAFDEGNYATALEDWQTLTEKYDSSPRASQLLEDIERIEDLVARSPQSELNSVIARSYLQNGDFWNGSSGRFTIDSSWLPKVEMATHWYDRIVEEFPGTIAAETAYRQKMFAILGWKALGSYASSYGLEASQKYLEPLLETFAEYESAFPESNYLDAFRFQIAQAYWNKRDWNSAELWLAKIQGGDGGKVTFYTDLADARLEKLRY